MRNKKNADNDNGGQIVSNGLADQNSCCEVLAKPINEEMCSTKDMEGDKPFEADQVDEDRPPKKTKCSDNDTNSESNGNG